MKRCVTSLALAVVMLVSMFGLFTATVSAEVEKQDWKPFDELVQKIKAETDFTAREGLLHQAEDMLMETGALVPLYYYNDVYMAKPDLTGYYSNPFGFKFFMFSDYPDHDSLKINLSAEPDKLDPALNTTVDGACLAVNSFSGLFTYNAEGKIVPDLADSYEVSKDGLTYTFTMKDDLKWSDGSPLSAKDFVYSWKRAVNWMTASDYSYMYDIFEGYPADAPEEITEEVANEAADKLAVSASEDGKTLTVKLKAPCAYFLDLMAFPTFYPVKQDQVESAKGYRDADGKLIQPGAWAVDAGFVSNGAYILKEWNHKESMVYEKNPYYHRADEVKINRLEFMLTEDAPVSYAAYQSGDLDFADAIPTDEIKALKESQNPEFHKVDELGTYFVIFNVNSKLFDGKTVEQANAMRKGLSRLIDRQYIIDTVAQTDQIPANTFIPAGMNDGHGGEFRTNGDDYTYPVAEETGYYPIEPDVDAAIELLKEAGFQFTEDGMLSEETPISFTYLTNDIESHVKIAESMQQDFAQIGIEMKIEKMDWATVVNERKAGNFDVARHGWIADFNDPINMIEMWQTESGNNDAQFGR